MGVNSLPKTVTRQRHGCDLNPDLLRLSPARLPLGYRATPSLTSSDELILAFYLFICLFIYLLIYLFIFTYVFIYLFV